MVQEQAAATQVASNTPTLTHAERLHALLERRLQTTNSVIVFYDCLKRKVKVRLDRFHLIEAVKTQGGLGSVKSRGTIFHSTVLRTKTVTLHLYNRYFDFRHFKFDSNVNCNHQHCIVFCTSRLCINSSTKYRHVSYPPLKG